jgi:kynureninase
MAKLVGASPSEVAVMQTLTANLHFLLASFYKPTKAKYKIIIEGKAFPSDHFAVQSHLAHRGYTCEEALVLLEPSDPATHYFSTERIIETIDRHAESTALILLPGVHFYSGQFLDIKTITAHAHSVGITIGWDLAHAAGNVPLQLHDWDVDFAAWCSYKYINAGPGSIGALFVHERHGRILHPPPEPGADGQGGSNDVKLGGLEAERKYGYTHRLAGWWGSSKTSRFDMTNVFVPIAGAAGWQLSNPSTLDTTSVIASLSVFEQTSIGQLRERSLLLTAYLEFLLFNWPTADSKVPYRLLTPSDPRQRGAQLSVRLDPGLLDKVLEVLEKEGVVIDERKPDVIRVAPAPLYNNFSDVWNFVDIFWKALRTAM